MQPSPYSRNVCLGSHINGFPGIQRLFPQNVLLFMVLGEGIAIYFTHNNIGWVDWLHWPQSTKAEVEKRRERKEEERVVRKRRNLIFSWVQDQPKLKKKNKKHKTRGTWRWFSPPPFLNPSPCCPEHFIVALFLPKGFCCCSVTQSCLTLCNPIDCSQTGSSVHGISHSRIFGVGCHFLL